MVNTGTTPRMTSHGCRIPPGKAVDFDRPSPVRLHRVSALEQWALTPVLSAWAIPERATHGRGSGQTLGGATPRSARDPRLTARMTA